jgi:hypothetical protein
MNLKNERLIAMFLEVRPSRTLSAEAASMVPQFSFRILGFPA